MGGNISCTQKLAENKYLGELCGKAPIGQNDEFWKGLFNFYLTLDLDEAATGKAVETLIEGYNEQLMENTRESENLDLLLHVFFEKSTVLINSNAQEEKLLNFHVQNGLIIVKNVIKFLCSRFTEEGLHEFLQKGEEEKRIDRLHQLVLQLTDIIIKLPVNDTTMPVHIEALKCCLALLSSQLYREDVVQDSSIFGLFLVEECKDRATILTKVLLDNYLSHNAEYRAPHQEKVPESIVLGLAGSLWNMVTVATGLNDAAEETKPLVVSLGSLSLLLALVLTCHNSRGRNAFKETMAIFQNSQEISVLAAELQTFKLAYNALYERLCDSIEQEPPMLLLYILLHHNVGFRNYVLSRINLEKLVLPILRILHDGSRAQAASNTHHMYLALIAVLILSEDDFFCKIIHETMVRGDWIDPNRPIGEISLGGLTIIVFIQTLKKNVLRTKDRYLHTNCLAALANMASCFKNLSPIVCQKVVGLIETLNKRYVKLVDTVKQNSINDSPESEKSDENLQDDVTVLEEGIRTLLEILNSAISVRLRHNANLIYTLLYHKELFDSFRQHPMFQDLLKNISLVIDHFSTKIDGVKGGSLITVIEEEALIWRMDKLQKFPELKFRYVEDENTIEFFVPYVWRLVYEHADLRLESQKIKVFNAMAIRK
ncbi:unnamed protein product, partial [Mesorhabditis spiculigera]